MKNGNLQRRILLVALLPAALLGLVLSIHYANDHVRLVEDRMLEHARATAGQIEPIAARGLVDTADTALLRRTAARAVSARGPVKGLGVRRVDGEVIARAGAFHAPEETASAADRVRVATPVHASGVDAPLQPGQRIGSIELMVDRGAARRGPLGGVLEGLGLIALALGITAFLAVRVGRTVTEPVHDLVRGVERIRNGEHDYRSRFAAGGELGRLEDGIRELAASIDETRRSLHERIEEATRELQATLAELEARNEELEAARREAEAASAFKSRFLANISHEIRTPMNSILGFTELLSQADLDPAHVDYLVTIRNAARSLLSLLNGILDLSKIESGRMELEYSDTDVNALLVETFNLLAPQAFAKGVEFVVAPAPAHAATVRADTLRLQQVLINLASNAVKFTDRGHVRIVAHAVTRADGGIGLTCSFTDTGRGIPHDAQTRLFQAFAQGENLRGDTPMRPAGTGLGLHIASEIAFLLDGSIEFRSEPGRGSEFRLRLELDAACTHAGSPIGIDPRRRVLFLSQDPDVTPAHVAVLASAGVDAEPVSGESPMDAVASGFDALLVDIPAGELHEGRCPPPPDAAASGDLPVLAYACAHSPDLRERLVAAGYRHVVQKTPEPATLRRGFERALGEHGAPGEAGPSRKPDTDTRPPAPAEQSRHVLLVDDQRVNLKLLESFLQGTHYATVSATASTEALDHACRTRFDAILLDIHLPERDGIEICRELRRAGEPNACTPIIAVTADAFADQAGRALAAGMNDILVKPVSRTAVLEKLDVWCREGGHDGSRDQSGEPGAEVASHEDPNDVHGQPLPLYDADDACRRAGGQTPVARELFAMLLGHLSGSRSEILTAHERGDTAALLEAAHRLKGAAAYCGVPRLRADLEALEADVRQQRDAATRVAAVASDIDALLAMNDNGPSGSHG